jgi:hypothetical protein
MRHWHTFRVLADAYIHELGEIESAGRISKSQLARLKAH